MKRPWQKSIERAFANGRITPGELLVAAIVDVAVIVVLLAGAFLCLGFASGAKGAELVPGAVLATRNTDEAQNTSPGSLNHLSLYVGNGEVIESQASVGVQKVSLADFLARPYETPLVLLPLDRDAGQRAATKAATLVGTKFRKASSLYNRFGKRRIERGLNCVALVELCYADAGKRLRRCTKPDDIFRQKEVFEPARRLERPAQPQLSGAQESLAVQPAGWLPKSGWYSYRPAGSIDDKGIYEEVLSRCGRRAYFEHKYARDKATCVHEACHGLNNRIWNRVGAQAFYCGKGRYCILREPQLTLPQIGRYVQSQFRTGYYDLYFVQAARTGGNHDRPLYVLDEFSAYITDLQTVRELNVKDTGSTSGTRAFCHFADCLVRAVNKHDADYPDKELLCDLVTWQKQRVAELSK